MGYILSDDIRTARKACPCDQCHQKIKVGERYRRQVHTFDGLVTYRAHEDCDAASQDLHKIADLNSDEWYCLAEYADDDKAFLIKKYPAVAARFWPSELPSTQSLRQEG